VDAYHAPVVLTFDGDVISWRGPAPYFFVPVPEAECDLIAEVAAGISYGWGVIPASVRVGRTDFTTSLFPKDGGYLVPIKDAVRRAEGIGEGASVTVRLTLDV
jgi:hypothetical protein